ncbi:MAG: hypothetical protein Q7U96_00540 [Chloroflexota bacterium]|nr:hypothetical protein [Chloroflexota bacterium]
MNGAAGRRIELWMGRLATPDCSLSGGALVVGYMRTNFGVPNTAWNTTAFGSITSTSAARQIQLALKLAF